MLDHLDMLAETLTATRFTLDAQAFVVQRNADGGRIAFNVTALLDAITLQVAATADDLDLTAISHTSQDSPRSKDPTQYRGHRVDISLP